MYSLLNDGSAFAILLSCIFHYSVFSFLSGSVIHATKSDEMRSRVVSSLHAIISSAAVLLSFAVFSEPGLYSPASLILGKGISHNYASYIRLIVSYSAGYFISDSIVMLRHKSVYSFDSIVHHAIILPAMLIALATKISFV
jgi:hypothetical protein